MNCWFPPPPPPLMPPPVRAEIMAQQVTYNFYTKPMGSVFTILETSAGSWQQKKAALSSEVVRRLLNTAEDVEQKEKVEIIEDFLKKLERSGYSKRQRRDIVKVGL